MCGSSTAATTTKAGGSLTVLYAGSLATLMQQKLGPAFQQATGYAVNGVPAGSTELAAEIKSGIERADVFISAAPNVDTSLEGSANGRWVSWFVPFGTSPLLLAYNGSSSFVHQLKTKPWYKVVGEPGFLLGRTDPAIDPKGVLAVQALDDAAHSFHAPALKAVVNSTNGVFPEQSLVGRLQAGQLDAGFFYGVEASAAHLPTVPLRGVKTLSAIYTVTIVHRSPDGSAARAFVAYLLGEKGRAILAANGITPSVSPKASGQMPAGVERAISK